MRMHQTILTALLIAAVGIATANAAETFTSEHQLNTKYSPLTQISKANIGQLEKAWEYHTGETNNEKNILDAFEDEPILIEGNLMVCSTTRRLIALDPVTGKQRWVYDPKGTVGGMHKCRGIAAWEDSKVPANAICKTRLYVGTADYRLISIDAKTGKACDGFGKQGQVKMEPSEPEIMVNEVSANSRPAVVNDVLVVGSTVADDQRVGAPSGRVLAFDARTGKQVWEFDPLVRDPKDPAAKSWGKGSAVGVGGGNVWAGMSVDKALDLVYLPTSSASVDFYGAARPGAGLYADSVVALQGSTGKVVWHFQFVHHNLWDYDTPTEPILIDLPYNGKMVPALVQITKMGLIYIFNRKTGEPLLPIYEKPVPQKSAIPGEQLSPTQPFPVGMPPLGPLGLKTDDAWGFTPIDRWLCKKAIEGFDHGPIYTPPSFKGTIVSPSVAGGPNWGGGAYDPVNHLLVVPTSRVPVVVKLVPREQVKIDPTQAIETRKAMTFPNAGAPYVTQISPLLSPLGTPCTAPPWAALTAVDLTSGSIAWEVPLGSIDKLGHLPFEWNLGTPGAGSPLITAGGLVFIGYTLDNRFRAFDLKTGEVLWKADMAAPGMSSPMTYEANGQQYVVITAGGHSMYGTDKGDSVVAYKLKK